MAVVEGGAVRVLASSGAIVASVPDLAEDRHVPWR
jgi:hypothetical protein